MKLVLLFSLTLVALVAGRAQDPSNQPDVAPPEDQDPNFFPDPEIAGNATDIADVAEDENVGIESIGVETFVPFTQQKWNCICKNQKFEDIHGKICTCDPRFQRDCNALFEKIKDKCQPTTSKTCRSKSADIECEAVIKAYFRRGCCSPRDDQLLSQARAALRFYGCHYCGGVGPCPGGGNSNECKDPKNCPNPKPPKGSKECKDSKECPNPPKNSQECKDPKNCPNPKPNSGECKDPKNCPKPNSGECKDPKNCPNPKPNSGECKDPKNCPKPNSGECKDPKGCPNPKPPKECKDKDCQH